MTVAEVLRVLADGVIIGPGEISGGMEGGGKRSSVYISNKMFESPTIAEGWSVKWLSADSKRASAIYGDDSETASAPS